MELLRSMGWPLLACLVLTGIHVHLGIHVLARKVIFVDLALAQIAAFGAVWAVLLGWDLHEDPWVVKGFSLLFTTIGALVFATTRMRHERVPHEAIIGVTYAVALAATILASARLAHGAEEMRELLAGSILWVGSGAVLASAALYVVVGAIHYVCREPLALISEDAEAAQARGLNVRAWDFLFYFTFGLVVTSSVAIAGVLLVFSYLVIPAVIAALFCDGVRTRLFAGWGIGVAVSVAGLMLSYEQDLPSGPTVVVSFGAALSLAGVAHYVLMAERRVRALLHVLGGALGLVVLLGGSLLLQKDEHTGYRDQLASPHAALRHAALGRAMGEPALWAFAAERGSELFADEEAELRELAVSLVLEHAWREFLPEVRALLQDEDDLVREAVVRCLLELNDTEAIGALIVAARREADEFLAVEMADSLCELGQPVGLELLIELMDTAELEFARHDAWEHVRAHTELELPFDDALAANDVVNDAMVARFAEWFAANGGALVWEPESGHFH